MANPLDSSSFVRLLDTRLREVDAFEAKYGELQSMIDTLFRILPSDAAWEEFYQMGATPDIPEFNGKLSSLAIYPGYHFKVEPKEYAACINAERKLIDDKKYKVLDNIAEGLMRSAYRTREKWAVRAFNNSFSSAFDFQTSEENLSLCNNAHLTKSQTSTSSGFDNLGTGTFSKTTVASTRLAMRLFRNDISERIEVSDNLALIVPDALADDAFELVKTQKGMDSAEGNVNMAYGRYKIIVYKRLDDNSTKKWWMVDMDAMKRDLMWIDRIKPEGKRTIDWDTYILRFANYSRFGYGFKDWRFIYGHNTT